MTVRGRIQVAELSYRNDNIRASRTDWGAVWAGLFTFVAIWTVFGVLGMELFGYATSTNVLGAAVPAVPATGLGVEIWAVVLTIIAMYVAGRETGHLAAIADRRDGWAHGMIVFGLSVAAIVALTVLGRTTQTSGLDGGTQSRYFLEAFVSWGWSGFFALFLGWLAAMAGASAGVLRKVQPERGIQPIRPAA
jgi:hypothetical protein